MAREKKILLTLHLDTPLKLGKKMKMRHLFPVLLTVATISCTTEKKMERYNRELLEADRAFSGLSSEEGSNHAFEAFAAREAVLLRPDHMPVEGRDAVTDLLKAREDSTFELTWEPMHARSSRSGDLGYTYGIYTLRVRETGQESTGTYASVWVCEDGDWKWVLDTGNQGTGE